MGRGGLEAAMRPERAIVCCAFVGTVLGVAGGCRSHYPRPAPIETGLTWGEYGLARAKLIRRMAGDPADRQFMLDQMRLFGQAHPPYKGLSRRSRAVVRRLGVEPGEP